MKTNCCVLHKNFYHLISVTLKHGFKVIQKLQCIERVGKVLPKKKET